MISNFWGAEKYSGWVIGEIHIDLTNVVHEVHWKSCRFTDNATNYVDTALTTAFYDALGPVGSFLSSGETSNSIRHEYIEIVYENNQGQLKSITTHFDTKGAHWRGGTYNEALSHDERSELSNFGICITDLREIYESMKDWEYSLLHCNCNTYANNFFSKFLELYAEKIQGLSSEQIIQPIMDKGLYLLGVLNNN